MKMNLDEVGYGNGLIYVGIPRERIQLNQFIDNRDALLTAIANAGHGCGFYQAEGHRVDRNRDQIVEAFLRQEKRPEWLLMIDTDMEHPVEAPMRLAAWKKPIVGALYFHRGQSHDPFVFDYVGYRKDKYGRDTHTWAPRRKMVYEFLETNDIPMRDGAIAIDNIPNKPLIECDAVGTGCILIHRSVFEILPRPWFEYRVGGNSEDLMFCKEAKEAGIPVYCDISTICGHYHWVAMGQAQFRMKYVGRGIDFTSYTQGIAARWWSKLTGVEIEQAIQEIKAGSPAMVGKAWTKKFKNRKPSPEEITDFYRDPEVGKLYAMELLHWNFLIQFHKIRKLLTHIHEADVLEIGAGIGTIALQLWIQGNRVVACEPNEILRNMIDIRYNELLDELSEISGQISIVSDGWIENTPAESQDYIVSIETLEHLSEQELERVMEAAWEKLRPGGRFIFTANFGQQDVYPMHFDHSKLFERLIKELGYQVISGYELMKVQNE